MSTPFPLGRLQHHDPQNFGWASLQGPLPQRARTPGRSWASTDVYDQRGSSCTAQSAVGLCRTSPHRVAFREHWLNFDTEAERHALYLEAQAHDPWPGGEPQYEGSSSDAPLRVLRNRGAIREWRWLFGIDEVEEWVTWYGPCGVGTVWKMGMFEPDADRYIWPTGPDAGGHAYRIVQYSIPRQAFRVVNSWSRNWGYRGRAWITRDVLHGLLEEGGEAVTIVA